MRYTLPGVSARTKAPSHAVSVPATISSLAPPVSCIITAAACVSGVRSDSIGISTNPPVFASSGSSLRARASQRHNDDGDTSFSRQNAAASCPLFSYSRINRRRARGVNRRRDRRCVLLEGIWESIVVMAQVPHVKTCLAIYQHSPSPPILYPVGRLLLADA
jgi:hypothetical protein